MALNFFKSKQIPTKEIPSRIKKMSDSDLAQWGNSCLLDLGRSFDAWRYRDAPLEEVVMITDTLQGILQELSNRVAS